MHCNCKPIQELLNCKIFWGAGIPPDPPRRAYHDSKTICLANPLIKVVLLLEPALTEYLVTVSLCNEVIASNNRMKGFTHW